MSLDTSIGGASANSYCTVAEASTYLASRVGFESWAEGNYPTEQKEAALIDAAQFLDHFEWKGDTVTATQALQFPRYKLHKRNGWLWYLTDEIPQEIKDAQCLMAFELLVNADLYQSSDLSQYSSIGIGNGELQVAIRPGVNLGAEIPSRIMRLVNHLIGSTQAAILRG